MASLEPRCITESMWLLREIQQLRQCAAMLTSLGIFAPAVWAFIAQRVPARDNLGNRRDLSTAQATAADDQVAQPIQQSVIDVVFRI